MNLTTQQFSEIVEQLDADVLNRNRAADDKRRAKRVQLSHRATIVLHEEGAPGAGVGVEVRDFSPRGIRFLHSEQLARGTQFVLELPQQDGSRIKILCTVMHCKATPEGPFSAGAEFTCVLRKAAGTVKRSAPAMRAERQRIERDRIRQSILG